MLYWYTTYCTCQFPPAADITPINYLQFPPKAACLCHYSCDLHVNRDDTHDACSHLCTVHWNSPHSHSPLQKGKGGGTGEEQRVRNHMDTPIHWKMRVEGRRLQECYGKRSRRRARARDRWDSHSRLTEAAIWGNTTSVSRGEVGVSVAWTMSRRLRRIWQFGVWQFLLNSPHHRPTVMCFSFALLCIYSNFEYI